MILGSTQWSFAHPIIGMQWWAIAAMIQGKDAYVEKPMTLTIEEGKAWSNVANNTGASFKWGRCAIKQRISSSSRVGC